MTGPTTTDPGPGTTVGFVVTGIDLPVDRWDRLGPMFSDVEEAGGDVIWTTDHVFSGHPSADPFVLATVAATATTRCAIGTGIVQLPLRRGAAVAKAASTLQVLSRGRFRLGVGVGQHRREFERARVDFGTRGRTTDRLLEEIRDHQRPTDDWYSMRPSTREPVPIWVGGTSEAALARTARFATGWLSIFQRPARFADTNRLLDAHMVAAGRDPVLLERHILLFVCPTDTSWSREEALGLVGRQFPGGADPLAHHVITGSPAECADAITRFTGAGADGVALQVAHPEPVARFAALRELLD